VTANPPPNPPSSTEFPPSDGWPDYPGFGSPEDVIARMKLIDWLHTQIGVAVHPQVGDYVFATDGRVLGHGPDGDALLDRLFEAEPELQKARIVQIQIAPAEY
jgi:hypothetical protein